MAKKPASNTKHTSFGRMDVDPAIADKLDHAAKVEQALKLNKGCNHERIVAKKNKRHVNKNAHIKHGHKHDTPLTENQLYTLLNNAVRADRQFHAPRKHSSRQMLPSNHNKQDQGYSGWSKDWNREAHTGVVGKPTKRRDRTDPLYSKYPFAPKK